MQRPTDSQWEAIRATDQHVLVAAAAGTGKTSTVVARILYLLGVEVRGERCPAPLALRDIGAITYTNAAAADLKRKLRTELRAAGLRDVAYEVDGARIGTIHGFCGDILREFALRTGRNPAVRILEEGDGAALVAEAARDTVLRALEEARVEGLEALFATWPVSKVEDWVGRLVGESARLDRIVEHRAELGALERTLVDLALATRGEVERRLQDAGAVDFDRMIVWTRDLLKGNALVRRVLQRRLRVLIVDEFQDVDPVQREIAYLLGEPASGRADSTRLMLVGDPKQSIYRFRRADVTVWREVQEDFETRGLGRVVPLAENFRSVEPVLGFVDAVIGPILERPIDGERRQAFEVEYQAVSATRGVTDAASHPERSEGAHVGSWPLRSAQGDSASQAPAVELLFVTSPEDDRPNVDAIRLAEADALARRARALHDAGIAWRDMAVLLSTWSSTTIYETALRNADIPTYALRAEGFHERREILDLVLALETLRDPRDDRALLGFLRSPFVGLRDETLLSIARQAAQPYWDYLHVVEVNEQPLLDWARALIDEHAALRDRIPTDRLLESLLERSGYLAHLYALGPGGDQALANVRKFVRLARLSPEDGVGDFLRALKETRERGDREGDARLYGEGENVLTITSIHSAKGLEWQVVFWCDLVRKPQAVKGDLLVGRDRVVLKDPELEAKDQPLHWRDMLQQEEAECEAERKRLWYVATTRAKDRLILSGLCEDKSDQNCPAAAIFGELGAVVVEDGALVKYVGQGGKQFTAAVRTCEIAAAPPSHPEQSEGAEPSPDSAPSPSAQGDSRSRGEFQPRPLPDHIPALSAPVGRSRHSATELMLYARCAQRHWFRYVAGVREPPVERSGPDFMNAIARGQIVHDVLEQLEREDELDPLLEAAIGRWDPDAPTPEAPQGGAYRDALRTEVLVVVNHPEYRALADQPTARRELPFVAILGPDQIAGGKVDLVAREGDGLAILDVKTGNGDTEKARRKAQDYALQRDMYVTALERIGGTPVNRFAFQFAAAGVQISEDVTESGRRSAATEIRRIIDEMGEGKPRLTSYPAECRWCGYKRVGWCEGADQSQPEI